ncbi:MAG: glycosyltransferase, partial [Pseudomonadota bacterium]
YDPNPLFDGRWYLERNPDVAAAGMNPLAHYIRHGAAKGYDPNPLFFGRWYLERNPDVAAAGMNPFAHYIRHGAAGTYDPNPLFFGRWYLERNPHVAAAGIDPLAHYMKHGAAEGYDPNPLFYGKWYLEHYPDVADAGLNPLAHYLTHGAAEGRDPNPEFDTKRYASQHAAVMRLGENPLAHYIEDLRARAGGESHGMRNEANSEPAYLIPNHLHIDFVRNNDLGSLLHYITAAPSVRPPLPAAVNVLVPVYGGREHLDDFFEALFANTTSPFRLILVDDGNRDPDIRRLLTSVAGRGDTLLLTFTTNQGYLKGICHAFRHAGPGHVVLLNTDTVVPPGWLERLAGPLFDYEYVACTTPFSNAATICSFPAIGVDNDLWPGLDTAAVDSLFSRVHSDKMMVELPTGVGFCMGMNRKVIDEIGFFNEVDFSRGYGEENEWCYRAVERGYINLHVTNLFVYHKHGGSFDPVEKNALVRANLRILEYLCPHYHKMVKHFFELDPTKRLRDLLAFLLFSVNSSQGATIIIDHSWGGGASLYRENWIRDRLSEGRPVVLAEARNEDDVTFTFQWDGNTIRFPQSKLTLVEDICLLSKATEVMLNEFVQFHNPMGVMRFVERLKEDWGVRLSLPVHEYGLICPTFNLVNDTGAFCDLPDETDCGACLQPVQPRVDKLLIDRPVSTLQIPSLAAWRRRARSLLRAADTVTCFSRASKNLLRKVFGDAATEKIKVIPHKVPHLHIRPVRIEKPEGLHVGAVGRINAVKGRNVLAEMGDIIDKEGRRVRLTIIGSVYPSLPHGVADVTGPYNHDDLPRIIQESGANVFFLPSIWPETFSYVAEELMLMDLPLAVFDIGAPAERVATYAKGLVIPEINARTALDSMEQLYERVYGGAEADGEGSWFTRSDRL